MTSLQRQLVMGALILPILLQVVLTIACRELGLMDHRWLLYGPIPTVAGSVWIERSLRLYAAIAAVFYIPLMLGFMWVLGHSTFNLLYL